jgi:N-acetylmuramoyl-L-alanine amidase
MRRIAASASLIVATMLATGQVACAVGAPSSCDRARFSIVIDVGHTPQAAGATSARGVSEYSFNLNLAHVVEALLTKAGFSTTKVLETTGLGTTQLYDRAARANAAKPDLFLSLHHDSAQRRYMSQWTYEGRTLEYSDKFAGYSIFVASNNAFSTQSLAFATLLSDALLADGFSYSLHHAANVEGENRTLLDASRGIYSFDGLIVLKQTRAPAVLLEAGVIVNRAEEEKLVTPAYQARIGGAIASAIAAFCATKPSGGRS